MKRQLIIGLTAVFSAVTTHAQMSATLSPYSQFGMGVLADQSQSFSRGMGGVGIGLRDGKMANMLNPASYGAVDSLSMIIDMGVAGQVTNFKEGGKKINKKTGDFDYAMATFRVMPKFGVSVGIVPFSNVGYSYYSTGKIGSSTSTSNEYYEGTGGFSQAFVGAGYELLKGFSIGANLSYFWGKYNRTVRVSSSDTYVNTITRTYSTSVSSYKIDLGAQWQGMVTKKDLLTLGATVGLGHQLGAEAMLTTTNLNNVIGGSSTDTTTIDDAFKLPLMLGFGASVLHNKRLTLAMDYTLQKWGALQFPVLNGSKYVLSDGILKNRHKVAVGLDWIPNPESRKYLSHVHYKLGASYATPYYNIKGVEGPKELSLSAGLGIPLVNSWNNRSTLNISAQWVRSSAKDLVTENTFRINIGLTFNERWFAKWKVD